MISKTLKMKKLFLLSIFSMIFFACSEDALNDSKTQELDFGSAFRTTSNCNFAEYDLLAGQHIVAGKITVEADSENLYVTYTTTGGWLLTEAHLHVGQTIPQRNGNPVPGQFKYKAKFNPAVSSHTFTVPRSEAGFVNDCTKIATHAVVSKTNNDITQTETGWAGNIEFSGANWARYFEFCIECVDPPLGCETAFLVGNNTFQSLQIGQRWGWAQYFNSGDGVYMFPFHAAAGQNNLNNGYQAGNVVVLVSGTNVNVSINLFDGVSLDEYHVYVSDNVPTTTAPGQYSNFTNGTFPDFTYSGDGNFWLIVHGVVCTE